MTKLLMAAACCALIALPSPVRAECGEASFYSNRDGRQTASGERFNENDLTAAMRLPRPNGRHTVTVTNRLNGRSVTVRINDYGPAAWTHRIIDLSLAAARVLGMIEAGHVPVCVE
jgi:rare lipoprotein A